MREVLRGTGFLLHVPGLMALLSIPVAGWADEWWGAWGFALTAAIALITGQSLVRATRGRDRFYRYHSMLIAGISWVLIAIIGAIPVFVSAHLAPLSAEAAMQLFRQPAHAFFESVSGFTSTGLTVVAAASELPHHIQWWRSFSQWVGGIGVILLLLAIVPAERGAINLYFSEARDEKILPTVKSTVQTMWAIYVGYTLSAIALLWIVGEPPWRAINHGMTAIATGGFTITDDSLMSAPEHVQLAYVPIMLAGAVSFLIHYRLIVERVSPRSLWELVEVRVLVWVLLGGFLLLWGQRWLTLGSDTLISSVLVWVSAITSAGFAAADLSAWADAALLLVLMAVLMGGMAGSTSGGIKLLRVGLLLKDLVGQLRSLRATPHEVVVLRYDGARITPAQMASLGHTALRLVGIFMLLWLLGVFVMLHWLPADTRLAHVFFDTASALFNSGLGTGVAGPDLEPGAAVVLSVLMLLGRLEVFPLLLLVAFLLGRR
ncbi:TrkH family potassium uptake protein [Spiribacter vilamensis]|uniref:Trk system potassium uptake protein TrkH n=1 Tax=Spiribacter vilamensis TaxID=531306 RepID=A0A4V2GIW6_9GAMM|nr:TrkH family potassium uptake protein [Spiribacter vilamensis]RZU97965.1 trk system potassium uptake protein TrkH [Spiribacter vilamensis]